MIELGMHTSCLQDPQLRSSPARRETDMISRRMSKTQWVQWLITAFEIPMQFADFTIKHHKVGLEMTIC